MRFPLVYYAGFLMAVLAFAGAYAGGIGFFILPLLGFVLVPLIDRHVGLSQWPSEEAVAKLHWFDRLMWEGALLWGAGAVLGLLGWGLWFVSSRSLAWWEFTGLVIGIGMVTGYVGIVIAHECLHRERRFHRALSRLLLLAAFYPHFAAEHVHGHHHRFGTPEDPATARRGESVYGFIPRVALTGLISAFGLRPLEIVLLYAMLAAICAAIAVWLGPLALTLFVLQGLLAIALLEGVQYVQHYGLTRMSLPGGGYASPGPELSWDSDSIVSNINLYNLARHSDHHTFSRRPYYKLRRSDRAPQLPYAYATMFLIAIVPPLWFRLMNPRLDAWQARRAYPANPPSLGPAA